jgi:hypothetical protein
VVNLLKKFIQLRIHDVVVVLKTTWVLALTTHAYAFKADANPRAEDDVSAMFEARAVSALCRSGEEYIMSAIYGLSHADQTIHINNDS